MESRTHRMCLRKRGYWSMTDAVTMARKREHSGAPALDIYKCPHCGRYHLTKKREAANGGNA